MTLRPCCRHRPGHRRRHRRSREHRRASRRGPVALNRHSHCAARTRHSARLLHHHSRGCLPSSHRNHGCHRQLLPRAGRHHDRGPAARSRSPSPSLPRSRSRCWAAAGPASGKLRRPLFPFFSHGKAVDSPAVLDAGAFRHCTASRRPLSCSRARGTCGRPCDAAHSQRPRARAHLGAHPAHRPRRTLPHACRGHLVCLQRARLRSAARGMDEGAFILDYLTPAGTSLTGDQPHLSSTSSRSCAAPPRSRSPAAAPGCSWGSRRSPRPTPETHSPPQTQPRPHHRRDHGGHRDRSRRPSLPLDVEFTQALQDMIGDLSNSPEPIQIKLFIPMPRC